MNITLIDRLQIILVMFFMSLIMSVQAPLFTPYAALLGASSVLIGIMLSLSQLASLSGNIIAGPLIDRFGKKRFIIIPMILAGGVFILHSMATNSTTLLLLRMINGFVLAFLIPAALALLSSYAENSVQQGKNMAIYGMMVTISSIVAPAIGGKLGALIGYENTYFIIGITILIIALYTMIFVKDQTVLVKNKQSYQSYSLTQVLATPRFPLVLAIGFAMMFIHGIIIYEVPYLTVEKGLSPATTGLLFSFFAIGTLFALSLFFIHRFDPFKRLLFGLLGMSLSMYAIIYEIFIFSALITMLGFFFGIIMPAMATVVSNIIPKEGHGRAFGLMSAFYSLGMIISTFTTGVIRDVISPYYIGAVLGLFVLMIVGYKIVQFPKVKRA